MILSTTDTIDPDGGEYLLFNDYGSEGMSLWGQYATIDEAFAEINQSRWAILRLVDCVFHIPN